ncbi:MAG: DUF3450 domain-containing protein [Deltaproteobacteria bacterium]|nr:DUF3450 domain-containing protein [Candidatus Tharpella sp.]
MKKIIIVLLFLASSLFLATWSQAANSKTGQRIEAPVRQAIDIRRGTQKDEENWRWEKEKLVTKFESLLQKQKHLKEQKSDLQQQLETTRKRIVIKQKQLQDIEEISSQIQPFLEALVKNMELQLGEGMPFLLTERQLRIGKLKELMATPEVPLSERYRKTMEALLIEAEYGFTTEVKQETIKISEQPQLVNIFRLGRISLFFQSLDQKHCGFYNVATKSWQTLPAKHNRAIQKAINIAAKRQPVEFVSLPLGRMVSQ